MIWGLLPWRCVALRDTSNVDVATGLVCVIVVGTVAGGLYGLLVLFS